MRKKKGMRREVRRAQGAEKEKTARAALIPVVVVGVNVF